MIISGGELMPNQKHLRRAALAAKEYLAQHAPADLPPFPISYGERERLKHGGVDHVYAWFARSLEAERYDLRKHPSFHDYACGVMASEHTPDFIANNEDLKKRFPPRHLPGLSPGLYWETPEEHAKTMASYRRSLARAARAA